jgi:hypothetical protein
MFTESRHELNKGALRRLNQSARGPDETAKLGCLTRCDIWKRFGDKRVRTAGLTGAIRALYQLSYIPVGGLFRRRDGLSHILFFHVKKRLPLPDNLLDFIIPGLENYLLTSASQKVALLL